MKVERNPMHRRLAALALAIMIATTSSVIAHADSLDVARGNQGSEFVIDGVWAAATCAFSMALAKLDPGFHGSAVMICLKAMSLDG